MRKMLRRFSVSVTDDDRVSEFTRWKRYGGCTFTRQGAWRMAKEAKLRSYRHVRIIEERIFKGAD